MASLFGGTIQLYITGACEMGCPHCSSVKQKMSNMTLATLARTVKVLENNGVGRIELFANDPILHPQIKEIIKMLNASSLEYAVLTVGASPKNPRVKEQFLKVLELIDLGKGAFVFSVDHLPENASGDTPYAFKARTFWELVLLLREKQIPARTNTVISRYNVGEVPGIIRMVAEMGFAASFCFVQYQQPEFNRLLLLGLTPETEQGFRRFMQKSQLLDEFQIDKIVLRVEGIVGTSKIRDGRLFNTFRGKDFSEGKIELNTLAILRESLLDLKAKFGGQVLPGEEFIRRLGNRGFGCVELLRKGQFPQLKVGSAGEMKFCCDLHDPWTRGYAITDLTTEKGRESFLGMVLTNPYIWICAYFNPCDFSVNHVVYGAKI